MDTSSETTDSTMSTDMHDADDCFCEEDDCDEDALSMDVDQTGGLDEAEEFASIVRATGVARMSTAATAPGRSLADLACAAAKLRFCFLK